MLTRADLQHYDDCPLFFVPCRYCEDIAAQLDEQFPPPPAPVTAVDVADVLDGSYPRRKHERLALVSRLLAAGGREGVEEAFGLHQLRGTERATARRRLNRDLAALRAA